jgi:hypothetical protein
VSGAAATVEVPAAAAGPLPGLARTMPQVARGGTLPGIGSSGAPVSGTARTMPQVARGGTLPGIGAGAVTPGRTGRTLSGLGPEAAAAGARRPQVRRPDAPSGAAPAAEGGAGQAGAGGSGPVTARAPTDEAYRDAWRQSGLPGRMPPDGFDWPGGGGRVLPPGRAERAEAAAAEAGEALRRGQPLGFGMQMVGVFNALDPALPLERAILQAAAAGHQGSVVGDLAAAFLGAGR